MMTEPNTTATTIRLIIMLIATIIPLGILLMIIRNIYKRNKSFMTYTDYLPYDLQDVPCPRCQETMDPGFIMAGKGMQWRKQRDSFTTFKLGLENTMNVTMTTKENRAWHCENCRMLVIDHSTMISDSKRIR